jgi:hypothetical protein
MISCEKDELDHSNTIEGTGPIVTNTLDLASFSKIELTGVANLYVSVGGEQSVVLKAQQNIIDVLNWEVDAGILAIYLDENVSILNHEEIRFEIVVNELFELLHDGVGNMNLEGSGTENFAIDHRGVGNINAYDHPMDRCSIASSAVGDCKIYVKSFLEVDISGVGDVYYRGNPEISVTDTGLGELINDN